MSRRNDYDYSFYPVPRGIGLEGAKIKPSPDADIRASEFNKNDLEGNTPIFKPIAIKVGKQPIPTELAIIDAYPGIQASRKLGSYVNRPAEVFNTYDLKGLPRKPLPPVLLNTRSHRINAFQATLDVIDQLHPEQALAKAIPQAQAETQRKNEEMQLRHAKLSGYASREEIERYQKNGGEADVDVGHLPQPIHQPHQHRRPNDEGKHDEERTHRPQQPQPPQPPQPPQLPQLPQPPQPPQPIPNANNNDNGVLFSDVALATASAVRTVVTSTFRGASFLYRNAAVRGRALQASDNYINVNNPMISSIVTSRLSSNMNANNSVVVRDVGVNNDNNMEVPPLEEVPPLADAVIPQPAVSEKDNEEKYDTASEGESEDFQDEKDPADKKQYPQEVKVEKDPPITWTKDQITKNVDFTDGQQLETIIHEYAKNKTKMQELVGAFNKQFGLSTSAMENNEYKTAFRRANEVSKNNLKEYAKYMMDVRDEYENLARDGVCCG